MTVPGAVAANGDPFYELEKGKLWLKEENNPRVLYSSKYSTCTVLL